MKQRHLLTSVAAIADLPRHSTRTRRNLRPDQRRPLERALERSDFFANRDLAKVEIRRLSWGARACVVFALLSLTLGCVTRELGPIDPKTSRSLVMEVGGDAVVAVDLLFIIDDSGSMEQEQASLRREIPQLVRDLTEPPLDERGRPRWNAAESIRTAVVTTNLGTNGYPVSSMRVGSACATNANLGRDGALSLPSACGDSPVAEWNAGDDVDTFVDQVACLSDVGQMGCGLEQQLAAGVRGLVQTAALSDRAFPRPDAVLAIVVVSDEEDCSIANAESFFAGPEVGRALNQKCAQRPDLLLSLEALKSSLLAGRSERDVIFSAIVGMPEDLGGHDPATVLADPRMQYQYSDANELGLVPACERGESGQAAPGRRYLELASLWPDSLVSSICAESFRPAIEALAARIGGRIRGICSNRSLTPDADGAVECEVRETLPDSLRCAELVGRRYLETDAAGRDVCTVDQAVRGVEAGWRFDVSNAECEQVAYTEGAVPPLGTVVSLFCLVEVEQPVNPVDPLEG